MPNSESEPVAVQVTVAAPDAETMRALGAKLAALLQAGDVLIATGSLGAGKTTFTQGLGEGMGVRGPIISPTFVISRIHPNLGSGPALVHVDAYRLGTADEIWDLDLEDTLASSVTLIEWGKDKAEQLADDRLDIEIIRSLDPEDETRHVTFTGIGKRWADAGLEKLQ